MEKTSITTIDVNIQDIAETALMKMMMESESQYGTCIVMETKTGKIKAMANLGRRPMGAIGKMTIMHCVYRTRIYYKARDIIIRFGKRNIQSSMTWWKWEAQVNAWLVSSDVNDAERSSENRY